MLLVPSRECQSKIVCGAFGASEFKLSCWIPSATLLSSKEGHEAGEYDFIEVRLERPGLATF